MLLLLEIGVKFSLYLTTLTTIGLGIHAAIGLPQQRRLLLTLALSLPMLKAVHLLLLNAQLSGDLASVFDFSMFDWIWPLHQAQVTALLIGCLVLVISLLSRGAILGVVGGLTIAFSYGLGGHTQGIEGFSIAPALVTVHLAVAGFWFAAPISLFPKQSTSTEVVSTNAERFGVIAIWLVPVIFLTGLATLWLLTQSFQRILFEAYGQLLISKLLLATIALALGAINHNHISGLLKSEPNKGERLLAMSLMAEAVLFTALLVLLVCATTITGPGESS